MDGRNRDGRTDSKDLPKTASQLSFRNTAHGPRAQAGARLGLNSTSVWPWASYLLTSLGPIAVPAL